MLAPAGMRQELAQHFGIGLGAAGLLMSLGAVVLCISSPQTASTITLVVEERHKPAAIATAFPWGVPRRLATVALPSQN